MTAWVWIDTRTVLAVHDRSIIVHGGAPGLRDETLLLSALARPRNRASYDDQASVLDLAAAYTSGLTQNHPFVDGNKRTGFIVGVLFLELHGAKFIAPEEAAAQAVLRLASGAIDEAGYVAFLRDNVQS